MDTLQAPLRMPIACTICAKAKTKCDRTIPSCSRCINKGLICEARPTRRLTDAARHAKKASSSYQRWASNSRPGHPPVGTTHSHQSLQSYLYNDALFPVMHPAISAMASSPPSLLPPMSGHFRSGSDDSSTQSYLDISSNHGQIIGVNASLISQKDHTDGFNSIESTPSIEYPFVADYSHEPTMEVGYEYQYPPTISLDSDLHSSPLVLSPDPQIFMSSHSFTSPIPSGNSSYSPSSLQPLSLSPNASDDCLWQDMSFTGKTPEEWPLFRCNPSIGDNIHSSLRAGRSHLDLLETALRSEGIWSGWTPPAVSWKAIEASYKRIDVEPFGSSVQDFLSSIVHDTIPPEASIPYGGGSNPVDRFTAFPSPDTLLFFIQAYMCRFELYYPMISTRSFSPQQLLESSQNKRLPGLLLLLMIAAGASSTPTVESGVLSNGLLEVFKKSRLDSLESERSISTSPLFYRAAALFVNVSAWSGNKHKMEVARSKWTQLTKAFRASGLVSLNGMNTTRFDWSLSLNIAWKKWKEVESMTRLVYSWICVDQEITLFHDLPLNFSITELNTSLPDTDILWNVQSAEEWSSAISSIMVDEASNDMKQPPSLSVLFKRLTNEYNSLDSIRLTESQARILLYPLQEYTHQSRRQFSAGLSNNSFQQLYAQMTQARLLLNRWYSVFIRSTESTPEDQPLKCVSLALYHLICLNTLIDFPDIEKLARGDLAGTSFLQTFAYTVFSPTEVSLIWYHCGQIIRLFRLIPEPNRPLWWPTAMYRSTLILWAVGTAGTLGNPSIRASLSPRQGEDLFPIDGLPSTHMLVAQYLEQRTGLPVLLGRNGVVVSLGRPCEIVSYCLDILSEGESTTPIMDGVKNRLARFLQRVRS